MEKFDVTVMVTLPDGSSEEDAARWLDSVLPPPVHAHERESSAEHDPPIRDWSYIRAEQRKVPATFPPASTEVTDVPATFICAGHTWEVPDVGPRHEGNRFEIGNLLDQAVACELCCRGWPLNPEELEFLLDVTRMTYTEISSLIGTRTERILGYVAGGDEIGGVDDLWLKMTFMRILFGVPSWKYGEKGAPMGHREILSVLEHTKQKFISSERIPRMLEADEPRATDPAPEPTEQGPRRSGRTRVPTDGDRRASRRE